MKTKLTITIDEELVPRAKKYARQSGTSLSELVERALRDLAAEPIGPCFSARWRGKLRVAPRDEARFRRLTKKYS